MNWTLILPLVKPALIVLGGAFGLMIHQRLKKPQDFERAQHLSTIARESAALLVSEKKGATWATLIEDLVKQLTANESVPTGNVDAIRRAAAGALQAAGVKP